MPTTNPIVLACAYWVVTTLQFSLQTPEPKDRPGSSRQGYQLDDIITITIIIIIIIIIINIIKLIETFLGIETREIGPQDCKIASFERTVNSGF